MELLKKPIVIPDKAFSFFSLLASENWILKLENYGVKY